MPMPKGAPPSAEDALQKALEIGRDCSVQRRLQKIIEEAPITVANQTTFSRMEKAAVRFGKLVGYVSACTVEYLYSHSDDEFHFLEWNPCLQVEHPTTEMVTSLSTPLEVFIPSPTHRAVTISPTDNRQYLMKLLETPAFEDNTITTRWLDELVSNKLATERPDTFLAVVCGAVAKAHAASQTGRSVDIIEVSNAEVNNFSTKHAITLQEPRQQRILELLERVDEDLCCEHFPIKDFDSWTIENPELEESKHIRYEYNSFTERLIIKCIVCKASLERGQVSAKNILKTVFPVDFIYQGKRYKFTATRSSADSYHRFINSSKCSVGVRALSDSGLLIMLSGRSYNVYWKEEDVGATHVSVDSKTCLSGRENDPTQLQTSFLETLVEFLVENRDHVKKG
ncbi:hypothetical protein HOY80DRAFT_1081969 [Tuber brumale]|nr:hypothetical protein HOY80DRAFT_1081969 [Tuber brumale]